VPASCPRSTPNQQGLPTKCPLLFSCRNPNRLSTAQIEEALLVLLESPLAREQQEVDE
jgi:hypothetical protein